MGDIFIYIYNILCSRVFTLSTFTCIHKIQIIIIIIQIQQILEFRPSLGKRCFLICWQGIFVTFQARASEHILVIYLFACQKEQMMLITAVMEESIQKVHMALD